MQRAGLFQRCCAERIDPLMAQVQTCALVHRIARPPMPHAPLLILPNDALRASAGRVRLPDGMDNAEP
ncbi:hypothetical protein ACFOPN_08430 [Xanthomonas hyacinthi]|uniref:Uncharacterized protein n=1 Tax=Xanthomonas hyacinthi TaxID=56455 RepID=A0A2S7ERE5_9XANT|nr:hypothetical protein Y886_20185 [Xanthomonas hyacinthi DSM 19077]PPU95683.1 hypothetical protein XhyaCFBP1156_18045 [Xanthomonas hyacinthi]